jgi:hypothetical protein
MTVDVTTTQNPVTVSVNDTNVSVSVTDNVTTATVSGGTGPQGPQGPQGSAASLTPATSTAIGGIIVGSGLSVTVNGTLSATGAVSSVAGRTGAVTLTTADVSGYTAPPVSSVAGRTGTVTLSTADISDYTSPPVTSVAGRTGTVTLTTADVSGYVAPQVFSVAGRTGTVTLTTSDISGYTAPPVSSVAGKTGTVTLTTSDISGFNAAASAAAPVQSVAGRTGAVTLTTADVGGYTAPTVSSVAGRTGTVTLSTSDISGLGTLATQSGTFSGNSSGTNTGDQTITLTGDVTGTGTGFFSATLAASGATAGTYTSVTVDTKGRVTSGTNPSGYSLPTATASVLGGIKIGSGLSIDGSGVVSAASSYTLPDATTLVKGGVIVGSGLGVSSGTLSANVTSVAGRTGAVTIASSDVSGLATSATTDTTNATNISSGTLPDARLSSAVALAANVSAFAGGQAASLDCWPRWLPWTTTNMGTSQPTYTFFTPLVNLTINRITVASGPSASQTGVTYGKLGLYTYNESTGVLTMVAETANDTTIYATASTLYTRALSNANGYPLTYALQAGVRYACATVLVFSGGSPSLVVVQNSNNPLGLLPRMTWYQNGQATLPTSSTLSGNPGNGFATFFRLSYV